MLNIFKSKAQFSFTYPCPRKLREIMKLSLIEREPKAKVAEIWMKYHEPKTENASYAISKREYNRFMERSKTSPMFMVPIKKEKSQGQYFMLLGQCNEKSIMFTYLEDFKRLGANAQPYYIMTLFDELMFKKEMALIRGDIIDYKIDKTQATWVLHQTLQQYQEDNLYQEYVYNFNHQTHLFDFEKFKQTYQLQ